MEILGFVVGGIVVLLIVVVAGNRMLRDAKSPGTGSTNAFGAVVDVFDPARARADRDLDSHKNQATVIPSADGDDLPVRVDLRTGKVTVRRTTS